jgi:hypothetical protein
LVIGVLSIVGIWKVLEKAKLPGWGSLIPIYNVYLLFKLAGRPGGWTRWILVPPVLYILLVIAQFDIAKKFGKSALFGVGLWLFPFIFMLILAFGDAKYLPQKS